MQKQNLKNRAFTLIEALTLLFIFSLITVTFYSVISSGTAYIQNSKNRLGALAVAQEKIEIIRNLDYGDVGTVSGGSVSGSIPEDEDVVESGKSYHVKTIVGYQDDDYDGTYPDDAVPNDFKRVIVVVSWGDASGSDSEVRLETLVAPPGIEILNAGDGILSINVFSDQPGGTGIPGANVHIVNTETGLDTNQQTDAKGNVVLVGDNIEDSIQKYRITVSKSGYETVNTMPPYPDSPYNPTFVHASVSSGAVNVANIIQNELADLEILTMDYLDGAVGSIDFHIVGGKQLGTEVYDPLDPTPNNPIYNLDSEESTDSNGEKDFNGISPGQYEFSLSSSSAENYKIIGTEPGFPCKTDADGNFIYSFFLFSDPAMFLRVKLADKSATSVLVWVLRNEDDSPVSGASVRLSNAFGYDSTQTTGADGKTFFSGAVDPFLGGTYDLRVEADGFQDADLQVDVNEGELKTEEVRLIAL